MKEKKGINPAALGALLKGDIDNFVVASTPGGIEAQEAQGQRDFVSNETLPLECLHYNGDADELLKSLGFELGDAVDDLFRSVKLPDGWSKKPTEHSMWSRVVDASGRERLAVFYKAAFYDRRAHFSFRQRISMARDWDLEERQNKCVVRVIADGDKILYETEIRDLPADNPWRVSEQLERDAEMWTNRIFPEWRDPGAYWNTDLLEIARRS